MKHHHSQSHVTTMIILLLLMVVIQSVVSNPIVKIPLTYVFDNDFKTKIPITIAFNHSNIFSTSPTPKLNLLNYNLSVSIIPFTTKESTPHIQIGLQYPSNFIVAVAASYGIKYQEVQFSKEQYLYVVLFDDNYVQSRDIFVNNDSYRVHVKYNFGDDYIIEDKSCQLIDGSTVFFQEYLIREALNKMTKENQINFRFNQQNSTITLSGKLQNLPKLTLVRGDYIFKITIKGDTINYLPSTKNINSITYIGYKAFQQFNRFKFDQTSIIFKRTSLIYQLYLFLAYFVLLTLFLVFISRKNIYESGVFIKHILKWAFMKDRLSRIQVLKSQLQ